MELIGIFYIGSGLLVLAGVAKGIRPDDTARALVLMVPQGSGRAPGFTSTRSAVRVGALLEAAIGACALLFPRPLTAVLVACSYMLFVCVVLYARSHGGALSTCGCFGRPDTPATGMHVLLNVAFVAAAVGIALHPPRSTTFVSLLASQPWAGVPLLLASGVGVWLAFLALSPLAALEAARRMTMGSNQKAVST